MLVARVVDRLENIADGLLLVRGVLGAHRQLEDGEGLGPREHGEVGPADECVNRGRSVGRWVLLYDTEQLCSRHGDAKRHVRKPFMIQPTLQHEVDDCDATLLAGRDSLEECASWIWAEPRVDLREQLGLTTGVHRPKRRRAVEGRLWCGERSGLGNRGA